MIITIGGDIGSGKSTVSKLLAQKTAHTHLYAGGILRSWCKDPTLNPEALPFQQWYATLDPALDNKVDNELAQRAQVEDNLILEGRMAFHWPTPFQKLRVYIACDSRIAADRVFLQKKNDATARAEESPYRSNIEAQADLYARQATERKRYLELYQVDIFSNKNYDLHVDSDLLTPAAVVDIIVRHGVLGQTT